MLIERLFQTSIEVMLKPLLSLVLISASACSAPVTAPVEFDDLCAFVFEHAADEDQEALKLGIVNLQNWLDQNRASVEEGYVVNNLDPNWVEQHEGKAHDLTDLLGVALALRYNHNLERVMKRILHDNEEPSFDEEGRITGKRTYNTDHQCFIEGTCDFVSYDTEAIQNYPLGIEAQVKFHSELRRVQTDVGTAVIARNWMTAPSDFNWDWITLDLSYYMGLAIEVEPGVVERTEATWMLAGFAGAPVSVDMGLTMALDKMKTNAINFRAGLDAEYADQPSP